MTSNSTLRSGRKWANYRSRRQGLMSWNRQLFRTKSFSWIETIERRRRVNSKTNLTSSPDKNHSSPKPAGGKSCCWCSFIQHQDGRCCGTAVDTARRRFPGPCVDYLSTRFTQSDRQLHVGEVDEVTFLLKHIRKIVWPPTTSLIKQEGPTFI
jgi:hypothetical protein